MKKKYSKAFIEQAVVKLLMKKRRSALIRPLNSRVSSILAMLVSPLHAVFLFQPVKPAAHDALA